MDHNQLESVVWKCGTVFLCIITLSISSCVMHRNAKIAEVIVSGANATEAACSFGLENVKEQCAIRAAK